MVGQSPGHVCSAKTHDSRQHGQQARQSRSLPALGEWLLSRARTELSWLIQSLWGWFPKGRMDKTGPDWAAAS